MSASRLTAEDAQQFGRAGVTAARRARRQAPRRADPGISTANEPSDAQHPCLYFAAFSPNWIQTCAGKAPNWSNVISKRKSEKPLAFLDTNVIASYLAGKGAAASIFDPKVQSHIQYAINAVVLQEIFLLAEEEGRKIIADLVKDGKLRIIDIDLDKADDAKDRLLQLRNHIAHSNNVLILASAENCDYLVTDDKSLTKISGAAPEVLSTKQFLNKFLGPS